MPQVFHPSMNTISRVTVFGAVFVIAGRFLVGGAMFARGRTPEAVSVSLRRCRPVSRWLSG
jgi:uncharacterized membrane protein HdeD (DUF308 family)